MYVSRACLDEVKPSGGTGREQIIRCRSSNCQNGRTLLWGMAWSSNAADVDIHTSVEEKHLGIFGDWSFIPMLKIRKHREEKQGNGHVRKRAVNCSADKFLNWSTHQHSPLQAPPVILFYHFLALFSLSERLHCLFILQIFVDISLLHKFFLFMAMSFLLLSIGGGGMVWRDSGKTHNLSQVSWTILN